MEFIGFEGDIEKRIKAAKEKAERVFYGVKTTIEEETLRLQYVISRHYGIPIFDNYFKDRTLDDLIFEIELISLNSTGGEEKMEEIMTTPEKRQELDGIFDDWNFETGPKPQQQPKKDYLSHQMLVHQRHQQPEELMCKKW